MNIAGYTALLRLAWAETARQVFKRQVINEFCFNIEVLCVATKLGYRIKEVPIAWYNSTGTKVDGLVKSQNPDGFEKSSQARRANPAGVRRTYWYAAMTKDAAQRSILTFYEAVKVNILIDPFKMLLNFFRIRLNFFFRRPRLLIGIIL